MRRFLIRIFIRICFRTDKKPNWVLFWERNQRAIKEGKPALAWDWNINVKYNPENKFCKLCRYFSPNKDARYKCEHPNVMTKTLKRNLVTGDSEFVTHHITPSDNCSDLRREDGLCGIDGKLFESLFKDTPEFQLREKILKETK
jgi:hypothetical protein